MEEKEERKEERKEEKEEDLEWFEVVDIVRPYVFKISTPRGSGTGFLISNLQKSKLCAIATAAHVVDQAHYWEEPIRIDHLQSSKTNLIRSNERAILLDEKHDTAVIIFDRGELAISTEMIELVPKGKHLRVGNEIGWLGFPAIPGANLCFFGGKVSAWIEEQSAYLVDGVAINGVSGGPAFHIGNNQVYLMGVVSAYAPNRATGETLPGLSVIRDITQYHELAPTFASLEQAKSQETPPDSLPPRQDKEVGSQNTSKRAG